MDNQEKKLTQRAPIVVVMGHVDHGKSTLLDYIRKTNIVDAEAGGITQHISAYEVSTKDEKGNNRMITFLDTPGHEAFSKMRSRGAMAADIAILVVSAEDSVKAQTMEAYNTIIENKIPYIVAINKIDRPNANIEKTKIDLVEKGIYLEGYGGSIPFACVSAKEGTGINDLLDMIILVADMEDLKGNPEVNASGVVIEAKCDPKRGIGATCIIRNGTLKSGMFVTSGESMVSTRMLENFMGKQIKEAAFSSPIHLIGFESMPEVGSEFESFNSKKEAENYIKEIKSEKLLNKKVETQTNTTDKIIPIIIKTDVVGTVDAIEKEIEKIVSEGICYKIISKGVGAINESDLKMASVSKDSVIVGFNTKIDNGAKDLNESLKIKIETFNIIYKLIDWLKELIEERRPRHEVPQTIGSVQILKVFGNTKDKFVVGGKVLDGKIYNNSLVKILRRGFEIGYGKVTELQVNKFKSREALSGNECGIQVETKIEVSSGDVLEAYELVVK